MKFETLKKAGIVAAASAGALALTAGAAYAADAPKDPLNARELYAQACLEAAGSHADHEQWGIGRAKARDRVVVPIGVGGLVGLAVCHQTGAEWTVGRGSLDAAAGFTPHRPNRWAARPASASWHGADDRQAGG